jgi:hypothetical protein
MDLQEVLFKDDLQFRNQKRQLWMDVYMEYIKVTKNYTITGANKAANTAVEEFCKTFPRPKQPHQ